MVYQPSSYSVLTHNPFQMVLDLIEVDFMCEEPKIQGKEKDIFLKKFSMLTPEELRDAFQVSCKRLLDIVSEIIPCVGCRRRYVKRFFICI